MGVRPLRSTLPDSQLSRYLLPCSALLCPTAFLAGTQDAGDLGASWVPRRRQPYGRTAGVPRLAAGQQPGQPPGLRPTPARKRILVGFWLVSGRHCDTSTRPGSTRSSPVNNDPIPAEARATAGAVDRW
jgi:hypothetical protein